MACTAGRSPEKNKQPGLWRYFPKTLFILRLIAAKMLRLPFDLSSTSTISSAYRDSKVVVVKNVLTMDAPKYSYKIGDTKKVTVTVKDQNGKAVAGKSLTLSIAGNTYTATTNANGIATFTPTVVTAGTYNYAVRFAGDVGTYAATVKGTMIVSR